MYLKLKNNNQLTFVSVFLTVVVVFPVDNVPVVLVKVARFVAVNCLFTESLICFSVSGVVLVVDDLVEVSFGLGTVGDFAGKLVGGFGLAVIDLGELAVIPTFDCTVVCKQIQITNVFHKSLRNRNVPYLLVQLRLFS